jgi:hypothetical protein
MSGQNDNNLLSFLKNQSLFNGSPTRKMSSRSRDRKSDRNRSPGANQQINGGNYGYNNGYNGQGGQYNDNNRVGGTPYQVNGGYGGQVGAQSNIQSNIQGNYQGGYTTTTGYNAVGNTQGGYTTGYSNIQSGNNFTGNDAIQTGLLSTAAVAGQKNYTSSFESARVETAQRLEGLAGKVKNEINNLNYKL